MTVEWECLQCNKKYQHPTFVIQHIVSKHYGGVERFSEVMQWILVRAVGEDEE